MNYVCQYWQRISILSEMRDKAYICQYVASKYIHIEEIYQSVHS